MAGGAASSFTRIGPNAAGICAWLWRKQAKPDESEMVTLLPAGGGALGSGGAGSDAHATAVRSLLPAFWRHFWPFLKANPRGRFLAGSTLFFCLLSAGLSIYISYTARDFNSALCVT